MKMKMRAQGVVVMLILGLTILAAETARAIPQLVPEDCGPQKTFGLGGFLELAYNGIQIIWGIAGALALLMFVWGGIQWLISAGQEDFVKKGKETLLNATIGLVLIFGSWLGIDFALKALGYKYRSSWTHFEGRCVDLVKAPISPPSSPVSPVIAPPLAALGNCCYIADYEHAPDREPATIYTKHVSSLVLKTNEQCAALKFTDVSEGKSSTDGIIKEKKWCGSDLCPATSGDASSGYAYTGAGECQKSGIGGGGGGGGSGEPPRKGPTEPEGLCCFLILYDPDTGTGSGVYQKVKDHGIKVPQRACGGLALTSPEVQSALTSEEKESAKMPAGTVLPSSSRIWSSSKITCPSVDTKKQEWQNTAGFIVGSSRDPWGGDRPWLETGRPGRGGRPSGG